MASQVLRYCESIMRSREPDVVIGLYDNPYVLRWHLIPRNRFFNVYLHLFLRGDEDDALHDHRADNISWILDVGYCEELRRGVRLRKPGRVYARFAGTPHRVHLWQTLDGRDFPFAHIPAVTIFITGPHRRNWGFHCPKGWQPWQKIVGTGHYGARPGCAAFEAGYDKMPAAREAVHGQTKHAP